MFWNRFYELCKEQNTNPTQLVRALGISHGTITRWKNGTVPTGDNLLKISEALNVSTDYLLGKSETKKPELQFTEKEQCLFDLISDCSDETVQKVIEYAQFLKHSENK